MSEKVQGEYGEEQIQVLEGLDRYANAPEVISVLPMNGDFITSCRKSSITP